MSVLTSKTFAPWSEKERNRLRLLRLEHGWSFREMADRIGMPEPTLRNVLESDVDPLQTTVYKIRKWLDVFGAEVV